MRTFITQGETVCTAQARQTESARKRFIAFNESMQTGGRNAAGSFANLDQVQLPFIDESVDRGSGYAKFGFGGVYAIKQCVAGRASVQAAAQ